MIAVAMKSYLSSCIPAQSFRRIILMARIFEELKANPLFCLLSYEKALLWNKSAPLPDDNQKYVSILILVTKLEFLLTPVGLFFPPP